MSVTSAKRTGIEDWEKPIEFTTNFRWGKRITFKADGFSEWCCEALPMIKGMKPCLLSELKDKGLPVGNNIFYLRPLDMWTLMDSATGLLSGVQVRSGLTTCKAYTQRGMVYFDDIVNIPVLCDKLGDPLMSLTPNEVMTLRGSVMKSKGSVGIAGLGLGWVTKKVLEKDRVDHVTVYEKDAAIIETFGKPLENEFGSKVEFIHCDAHDVSRSEWLHHDVALWDIWYHMTDRDKDERYVDLKNHIESAGKTCIGWGRAYPKYR